MAKPETKQNGYNCNGCNQWFPWENNGISTRNPATGECNSCYERNESIANYKRLVYEKTIGGCDLKLAAMERFILRIGENPGMSPKEIYENDL